jgi:anti-anti-sigma factor
MFRNIAPPFACDVRREPAGVRVCLSGELDLATIPLARAKVEELLSAGRGPVVLDLTRLDFIDSAGLRFAAELERVS